jgi:predicted phosphodiesterase
MERSDAGPALGALSPHDKERPVRLALISDIHANLEALEATFYDIAERSIDRIVCLGDIVGYNSDAAACIALIRGADCVCVAGNHDLAVCGRITTRKFSSAAARAVAWTRQQLSDDDLDFLAGLPLKANIGNRVVAVHGALHPETDCESVRLDTDKRRRASFEALMIHPSGARICAYGHTHHAGVYEMRADGVAMHGDPHVSLRDDAYYLINPGTIGEPRSAERRATYMILDLERRTVTTRHVDYRASAEFLASHRPGLASRFGLTGLAGRLLGSA